LKEEELLEKPLQMTKILKRLKIAPAVSRPLHPIKVEKTLGSRTTTTATQKRRDREVKTA
jgi:hypothetical protein